MYTYQFTIKYNANNPQSAEMWRVFGQLMTELFKQKELEFVSELSSHRFKWYSVANVVVQANWGAIVKLYTLCRSAFLGMLIEQVFMNHAGQWTYASTIYDSYDKAII